MKGYIVVLFLWHPVSYAAEKILNTLYAPTPLSLYTNKSNHCLLGHDNITAVFGKQIVVIGSRRRKIIHLLQGILYQE